MSTKHGLKSPMFCGQCDNFLHDCTCEDLAERMRELTGAGGPVYSRWCRACDNHYCRCDCDEPDWWIRNEGELIRPITDEVITVHTPRGGPIQA